MLLLTGWFAANAALLFWQRKRTRVSFFSFFLFYNTSHLAVGQVFFNHFWGGNGSTEAELLRWKPPDGFRFWGKSQRVVPVVLRCDGCSQEAQPATHSSRPRVVPAGLREWVAVLIKLHIYWYQFRSLIKGHRKLYSGHESGCKAGGIDRFTAVEADSILTMDKSCPC